jgi:hypothetical protein
MREFNQNHTLSPKAETKMKNDQAVLDLVYGKGQLACVVAQRSDPERLLLRMLCYLPF